MNYNQSYNYNQGYNQSYGQNYGQSYGQSNSGYSLQPANNSYYAQSTTLQQVGTRQPEYGRSAAGLAMGVLTLVLYLGNDALIGLVLGILGIVFSAMARKRGNNESATTAGLILSIVGTVLCAIDVVYTIIIGGAIMGELFACSSMLSELDDLDFSIFLFR